MKHHLSERELIKYQFGLLSASKAEKVAKHFTKCDDCWKRAKQLKAKFASLDVLKQQPEASADLISKVTAQAAKPSQPKVFTFRRPAWLAAAAAVLLVGGLLLISQLTKDHTPGSKFAKELGPATEDLEFDGDVRTEDMPVGSEAKEFEALKAPRFGVATAPAKPIPAKPPFAPASAIELVTLPRRDNVQLTIYNSTFQTGRFGYGGYGRGGYGYGGGFRGEPDMSARKDIQKDGRASEIPAGSLTLVRERRNLTLKKGWNWLQFMWSNTLIDPTSLHLQPLAQKDKIDIQQLVFPARLKDLGRWLIRSETEGQVPFEITYFTSGLGWRAFYMGTLSEDEKTMQLKGYVRVANKSGEDYENAQTRLIVGKVHILDQIAQLAKRKYPYGRPRFGGYGGGGYGGGGFGGAMYRDDIGMEKGNLNTLLVTDGIALDWDMERKEVKKEGLSEYFLYTIEGTETIPDKWGKRLMSFEAEDIEVESLYKYDEERWRKQTIRFVAFTNDEEHNLGETPIPNGNVKIYAQADESGHLSYVGGTSIKYIPVDEEIELNLGQARLVSVKPILGDFKTDNYMFDKDKNIAGWDEIRKWKIEVTNTRKLPVEIEITRGFKTPYWTLQMNRGQEISYKKHDATHARFTLKLKSQSKRTFTYTVTTYHGVRQEAIDE